MDKGSLLSKKDHSMSVDSIKSNRNFGIDILRMVSMYLVVVGHVLAKGNILNSTLPFSLSYEILWLMKVISVCAVNTFGIISGYVGYKHSHRQLGGCLYLWFKVIAYSFGITAIFYAIGSGATPITLVKSLFPVLGGEYWYFNAYLGCCVLSPLINIAVENASSKQLKITAIIGFVLFSVIGTASIHDVFTVEYGYSVLWLSVLWFIGAFIKKYDEDVKIKSRYLLWGFFGCVGLQWGMKLAIEFLAFKVFGEASYGNLFLEYTSPFVIGMAVMLVLLFRKINIGERIGKTITNVSGNVFFVYIIHMHPMIINAYIQKKYEWVAEKNIIVAVLLVIMISFVIFISALLIDCIFSLGLNQTGIKERLKKADGVFYERG